MDSGISILNFSTLKKVLRMLWSMNASIYNEALELETGECKPQETLLFLLFLL